MVITHFFISAGYWTPYFPSSKSNTFPFSLYKRQIAIWLRASLRNMMDFISCNWSNKIDSVVYFLTFFSINRIIILLQLTSHTEFIPFFFVHFMNHEENEGHQWMWCTIKIFCKLLLLVEFRFDVVIEFVIYKKINKKNR